MTVILSVRRYGHSAVFEVTYMVLISVYYSNCDDCYAVEFLFFFFFPAEDGIRDVAVTGTVAGAARYSRDYVLGISCEKCHGDGSAHVRYQTSHPMETSGRYILNPARFSRDRKVDNCALCHAGERDPKVPPFSYRPGDKLDDYFAPPANAAATADVHGNQVALLQGSKCFRSSPGMSCSTCHDVHRPQRDVTALLEKWLACHETSRHPMATEMGERLTTACIDCHMPNRRSKAIEINTPTKQFALYFRSHAIGIYPEVARAVLRPNAAARSR